MHLAIIHIPYCQFKIPKLYKLVTAMAYGLNRLDGKMTSNLYEKDNR